MTKNNKINYLEIPSKDLLKTKAFFSWAFGWEFIDYGPEYCALKDVGIDGGFYLSDLVSHSQSGSCLIVLYSDDLISTQENIVNNNGVISKPIFTFPGGSRFHFTDPNGNEYAVWKNA